MGDRLAKALEHAGMSNQQMAEYLGVSRNTVGNYIALRTDVTLGTLRLWAMVTGVELEWLRTGESSSGSDGPGEGQNGVRHQGLEPRTRCYEAFAA